MSKKLHNRIWVAIDVGTTKICVLVARGTSQDDCEILGVGQAPSDGLRRGVVVDIAKTVRSIKKAVAEAQLMSGITIESAAIGIAGAHIQSRNASGAVPIKKDEVKQIDIDNVISAARAIPLPEGQQVLHVLPKFFMVDGQDRVHDPLGLFGVRLEAQVHIITGAVASVQNLVKCCQMAGVKVSDVVLEQIASADAVLSEDERELGIGVLDIGGGTSDFAIYQNGTIRHTKVTPIAGNQFTNDLAIGLNATLKDAERIKREHGLVHLQSMTDNLVIDVEKVQGNEQRTAHLFDLVHILQPRAAELLSIVNDEVIKYNLQPYMRAGLVLTGGGSLLGGLPLLAREIFGIPVRVGRPRTGVILPESLDHPMYATGYGLIVHEMKRWHNAKRGALEGPFVKGVFLRMKSWVSDFF